MISREGRGSTSTALVGEGIKSFVGVLATIAKRKCDDGLRSIAGADIDSHFAGKRSHGYADRPSGLKSSYGELSTPVHLDGDDSVILLQ